MILTLHRDLNMWTKVFVLTGLMSFVIGTHVTRVRAPKVYDACEQSEYDQIYKRIIEIALDSNLNEGDTNERNNAIESLTRLCHGQRSTYERGLK